MSVAALEAMELRQVLAANPKNLARQFLVRAAKVIETPWAIAANNDLRMLEARGRRTLVSKFLNGYMARLLRASHHDPVLALAFHRVANLLAAPPSVLHPKIALRVLKGNLPRTEHARGGGFRTVRADKAS